MIEIKWTDLIASAEVDDSPHAKYTAGTHLVSPRKGGLYTHHGIYVGNGDVIHHSGWANGLTKGKIKRETLEEFRDGNPVAIILHRDHKTHWKTIVSRAVRAEKDADADEWQYSPASQNCEHFSTWCVTGEKKSSQVDRVIVIILGPVLGPIYAYFRE